LETGSWELRVGDWELGVEGSELGVGDWGLGVETWELEVGSWEFPDKKALHRPSARDATAEQARRKDSRVVQNKKVARLQVFDQISENPVRHRTG
jgi:hypothetical protein